LKLPHSGDRIGIGKGALLGHQTDFSCGKHGILSHQHRRCTRVGCHTNRFTSRPDTGIN
jgi:hypothetical protein